jgi:transposase
VHAIRIPHGYSKDHRPDFKQVVLELMVSQDGGGFPL